MNLLLEWMRSILKHQKLEYQDAIEMQSILKYRVVQVEGGIVGIALGQYLSVTATAQMSLILSLTTCINSPHISNIYKYTRTLPVLERTKLNSASESLGGGSGPNQPAHLVASPLVHCCISPQASWREEQLDPATTINVESDFIVKCHFWSIIRNVLSDQKDLSILLQNNRQQSVWSN